MFNKTFKIFPLLAVAAILTGCAHKIWYQPGISADQTRRDLAACKLLNSENNPTQLSAAGLMVGSIQSGNFINNCMEAKGYQRVPTSQLPPPPPTLSQQIKNVQDWCDWLLAHPGGGALPHSVNGVVFLSPDEAHAAAIAAEDLLKSLKAKQAAVNL